MNKDKSFFVCFCLFNVVRSVLKASRMTSKLPPSLPKYLVIRQKTVEGPKVRDGEWEKKWERQGKWSFRGFDEGPEYVSEDRTDWGLGYKFGTNISMVKFKPRSVTGSFSRVKDSRRHLVSHNRSRRVDNGCVRIALYNRRFASPDGTMTHTHIDVHRHVYVLHRAHWAGR